MESCVKRTLKTVPQRLTAATLAVAALLAGLAALPAGAAEPGDLWRRALDRQPIHRFSTLITASQVRDLLATDAGIDAANVQILPLNGAPKSLLELSQESLDAIRRPILEPIGRSLEAPCRVALYLFSDGSWVIENFNDRPVTAKLDGQALEFEPRGWICRWK